MITGLDLNATIDFQLSYDKKNPTIWKLGVIPGDMYARIINSGRSDPINSAYNLLQAGLKGWENTDLEFKQEEVFICGEKVMGLPLSLLGKIPVKAVNELSEKIMEIQELAGTEVKN